MDPTPSPDSAKLLAPPTSRRQALKALTATAVGGPLALDGIGTAFLAKLLGACLFGYGNGL